MATKPRKARDDIGLEIALLAADGVKKLADGIGLSISTVSLWKMIPPKHVLAIEKLTGIPREELRPDLYPSDERPSVVKNS
jgi:DNA-binding transcriptional regulator YdaS (Cro superfamily)